MVTLYFFTFGAVAASAIGDTRDVSSTAATGITKERIFMREMVQKVLAEEHAQQRIEHFLDGKL